MPVERPQVINFLKSIHPFRRMSEEELALFADGLKDISFEKGKTIFEQDDESEHLYILMKGRVETTRFVDETTEKLGVLDDGVIFGYEMWLPDQPRQITATALTDTILLWVDWETLRDLAKKIPVLNSFLEMMTESYYFALESHLKWRDPEEYVIAMYRKHPFVLLRRLLPSLIAGLVTVPPLLFLYLFQYYDQPLQWLTLTIVILIILRSIWIYIDWANDDYTITNHRVVSHERVLLLYDNRQEIPFDALLSITSTSDYWGRRYHFADILLKTYTGALPLRQVPYYDQIVSILEERKNRTAISQIETEKKTRTDTVRQRLGLMPAKPAGAPHPPAGDGAEGETLFQWIASQFRLRTEQGGNIIYRTHWIFLAEKVIAPSLFLISFLVLSVVYIIFPFTPLGTLQFILLMFGLSLPVIGWWLYNFADWSNDAYIVTDEQVIDVTQKPFGQEIKKSAPLGNITNIEYKRLGIVGMLFNYGTVYIRVGDMDLTFDQVNNPSEVQREIFHRLAKRKQMEKFSQVESEKKLILDWLEAYHQVVNQEQKPGTKE